MENDLKSYVGKEFLHISGESVVKITGILKHKGRDYLLWAEQMQYYKDTKQPMKPYIERGNMDLGYLKELYVPYTKASRLLYGK